MKKEILKKEEVLIHHREIEDSKEKDLWENLNPDTRGILEEAVDKLIPYGLATVETGITDEGVVSITIRKTSDKSIIFYTETPSEVEMLKELEIIPE